jgi:hypothetical protein
LDLREIGNDSGTVITAFQSAYKFLTQPSVSHDVTMIPQIPKIQFADPRGQDDLPIEIIVGVTINGRL